MCSILACKIIPYIDKNCHSDNLKYMTKSFSKSEGRFIMVQEILLNKCDLFIENYQILKKNFIWDYSNMHRLGALFYANAGRKADPEAIKAAKEFIKENTGFFSCFKETTFFALAVMLSLEENPKETFRKTLKVYDEMKMDGFHSSVYLTLASFSIARQIPAEEIPAVINKAKGIYDAMKKEHRFLTSTDDYGYAAMLAMSDRTISQAIADMEYCYELLKPEFGAGNSLQSLTHVLTLAEETAEVKCLKARKIYDTLSAKGCKFSKYNVLSALGTLVFIEEDVDTLGNEIKMIYERLLDAKGLGSWSLSKHERTMYASALVADAYIKDMKENPVSVSLSNSITNIIIAQQTAIIAATSASAAAAASSGS